MFLRFRLNELALQSLLKHKALRHFAAGVAVFAAVTTGTWAVGDQLVKSIGLKGLLPAEVPAGITADDFAALDGNWAEWSAEAAKEVADLYAAEGDAAANRAAIAKVRARIATMDKALADSRYSSLFTPLRQLRSALSRRLELMEAVLDTLNAGASSIDSVEKSRGLATEIQHAITALKAELTQYNNGQLWLPYLKEAELSAAVQKTDDVAGLVAAAKNSLEKLDTSKMENAEQKDFISKPFFGRLRGALADYVTIANRPKDANATGQLTEALGNLLKALDAHDAKPGSSTALAARKAYDQAVLLAADNGARLSQTLQRNYFNYNVRIFASEQFLGRVLSDERTESGGVVDCILGASVTGCQCTNTKLVVDLQPSNNTARFSLRLTGNIQSDTQGVTPQATIWTHGSHCFEARKEVLFDGDRFTTSPATISINPNNTTTGVNTKFSWIPLLGRIADNIAYNEAENRRSEAEAIAASRIQDKVLPRFDSEVNSNFEKSNQEMQSGLFGGLKAANLWPDHSTYQTTHDQLRVSARLINGREMGGSAPPPAVVPVDGAVLWLHESAINNALDRMNLAGRTFTDEELRIELQSFLSKALNRSVKLDPPPKTDEDESTKKLKAMVFAKEDPIRIQADSGQLVMTVRVSFKQYEMDDLPFLEISIPLSFAVEGNDIAVTRGKVKVADLDQPAGIAVKGVVRKKMEQSLPDRKASAKFSLKADHKEVETLVRNIQINDGWISVEVR